MPNLDTPDTIYSTSEASRVIAEADRSEQESGGEWRFCAVPMGSGAAIAVYDKAGHFVGWL